MNEDFNIVEDKIRENEHFTFWIENDILFSTGKKPVKLTLEIVKELIEIREDISNYEPHYWCFDITSIKSYNKEAMEFAKINGERYIRACAVIVTSHTAKFIFNSYQLLQGSTIPFQAFNNKEDALTWLSELRAQKEG